MPSPGPATLLNQLVDTHWTTAARHAWNQYQQRGRGAVVFPVDPSGNDNEQTPLKYLTFNDEAAAQTGPFAKLYELIETYDPETELIAAAQLPDDQTVFDVYEKTPSPPDA